MGMLAKGVFPIGYLLWAIDYWLLALARHPPNNFFSESKKFFRRLFLLSAGSEFGLIGSPLCTWPFCEGTSGCGKVSWEAVPAARHSSVAISFDTEHNWT